MQNVEFKAELRDPQLARAICGGIGARWVGSLEQTDTYYRVADGRLKKRECPTYPPEYIFYHRPNGCRPRLSTFTIYSEEAARQRFGLRPLPVWVNVHKQRDLYHAYEGVRVHIDSVSRLGAFIEFEALICPERSLERCHELVDRLRGDFRPALGEPIDRSYADLLADEAEAVR